MINHLSSSSTLSSTMGLDARGPCTLSSVPFMKDLFTKGTSKAWNSAAGGGCWIIPRTNFPTLLGWSTTFLGIQKKFDQPLSITFRLATHSLTPDDIARFSARASPGDCRRSHAQRRPTRHRNRGLRSPLMAMTAVMAVMAAVVTAAVVAVVAGRCLQGTVGINVYLLWFIYGLQWWLHSQ